MKKILIAIALLFAFGWGIAQETGNWGRGGSSPLTAIKRQLPIYTSGGVLIGYIALNDTSAFHLENNIWMTADSASGGLGYLFKVNASDEWVSGWDLTIGKLELTPGADMVLANMDTVGEAEGELSLWITVGDSEFVELYTHYEGDGTFDSSRVDINAVLHVGSDLRVDDAITAAEFGNNALQTPTLGVDAVTFAVTSNVITVTGDGGANVIGTITGAHIGLYTFIFVDGFVTITDTDAHDANSVDLVGTAADFVSADDTVLQLVYDGTSWYEVSRSVN